MQNAVMKIQWYSLLSSSHLGPCHPYLLTVSTNLTRQTQRPSQSRHILPWHPVPCLALQWPPSHGVHDSSLQHPHSPEAPRQITEACVCNRSTQPVNTTQIQGHLHDLQTVHTIHAGWPALSPALSFLLTNNLSNALAASLPSTFNNLSIGLWVSHGIPSHLHSLSSCYAATICLRPHVPLMTFSSSSCTTLPPHPSISNRQCSTTFSMSECSRLCSVAPVTALGADMDLRRLGLVTLHQILQASGL